MISRKLLTTIVVWLLVLVTDGFCTRLKSAKKPPVCVKIDDCSCRWENGSVVDLHAVGINGGIRFKDLSDITGTPFKFSYNPCYPFTETAASAYTNQCHGVASCENDGTNFFDAGLHNYSHFFTQSATSGGDDYILTMQYTSADQSRQTDVWLFCATYENLTVVGEIPGDELTTFLYWLYSPHACPYTPTLSFGSILCIIFFSVVVLYFIVGFVILKFVQSKSGLEAVPNGTFWTSLPSLIKEGIQFILGGCKASNSAYTSI